MPAMNPEKWAVIACDQYTSEPEYWENVKKTVGNAPSALNIIFPEVFLGENNADRISKINATLRAAFLRNIKIPLFIPSAPLKTAKHGAVS